MIWLLQMIFFGHMHTWEDVGQSRWRHVDGAEGPRFVCKCKKCGSYKTFDL